MATPASPPPSTVEPAQLGFLAIFNPSLGATDDTIDDQIVYYASVNTHPRKQRHRSRGKPTDNISQDERNERLRQIGLAQGMVEFSRGFAGGNPVDTIETEKTRVVLHELEPGWWILVSINLTKLPLPPRLGAPDPNNQDELSENVEYSSREIKPAALLMQDLLRAHSIFLLHHSASLSALFVRKKRPKFVSILSRYWDLFLSTWDVMLHGNPAVNVFGGIKIAACGELGFGVGEEERGSGEREVLEGFVDRVEGLVDLIVSKFGPSDLEVGTDAAKGAKPADESAAEWLGTGEEPGAEDGAVFLGVGSLSRKSLRDITHWMQDIYTWGEDAYGVKDSPTSTRQTRRARKPIITSTKDASVDVSKAPRDRGSADSRQPSTQAQPTDTNTSDATSQKPTEEAEDEGGVNKIMSYLKLGYGTHWALGTPSGTESTDQDKAVVGKPSTKDKVLSCNSRRPPKAVSDDSGRYLIGLLGDVEETGNSENDESKEQSGTPSDEDEYNSRVLVRTLTVELDDADHPEDELTQDLGSQDNELTMTRSGNKDSSDPKSSFNSQDRNKARKMRVVVYVSRPFIYTFLFQNRTDSLAWDGLYRSLHYQLAPLRKPLAISTSYRPGRPDVGAAVSHIFDLVWDPKAMTIHSTIPNIPTLEQAVAQQQENPHATSTLTWSRAEALSTHNQILNTYVAAATDPSELERTCKTRRGWWIVWSRVLDKEEDAVPHHHPTETGSGVSTASSDGSGEQPEARHPSEGDPDPPQRRSRPRVSKEIFLVRRAGEQHHRLGRRGISGSFAEGVGGGGGGGGWADGASRLAQGIGVDTRKYIEDLLSLSR
ncbi:hypothetical protein F4779DRAFT_569154 [Xylariaceae sp. FL0662B]|nr:hypothetical protein F4779DRAFT_569154 [Xylariaceae sp. FL0662B]